MAGILAFLVKVFQVLPLAIVSGLGIVQAVIKFLKELITLVVNTFFPLFPDNGKFEQVVNKVRDIVNKVDTWVELLKTKILIPLGLVKA